MSDLPIRNPLAVIADDAIEHARYSAEQARWLEAVAYSIHESLEGGRANLEARLHHAKALASLANYLAHDLSGYSANRAADMQKQLDATEAQE